MRGLTAKQVMTSEVLAAEADWSIERLCEFLIVKSISGAPVQSKKGSLIGVVSLSEDALDLIYHHKPDLVILDIMLPGIDGYEVCKIVRLDPNCRDIKIIFLTTKGREVEIAKGLALGADAYITKPYSNAELVSKVKELLENTHEKVRQ